MEVSALRYSGGIGLAGRSPLLRLQSDERLIALVRRGNSAAFEVLFARYHSRLLAFCRHMLGSKEDAEDVLQEVMAAAFNAILADERAINVRPWLYRIARNRSLNHLRRIQAIGVDSMDIHFSDYGTTTADKVHDREQFRLLVQDIHGLPETQRTALVLREMDALSYEQIAEAMDTTVPGVKSLLVRARVSLAEAAEARQLSCDEVRMELAEVAEGLRKRPPTLVRRHLRSCTRCATFQGELKNTNKVLAALIPIGPLALLRKLLIVHLGHSAGTGSAGAGAAGATGATTGASAGGLAAGPIAAAAGSAGGAFGSAGGLISAGAGALASKAAAGLAAAALVTAGAVEATHVTRPTTRPPVTSAPQAATGGASANTVAATSPTVGTATTKQATATKTKLTAKVTPATTTTSTTTATTPLTSADAHGTTPATGSTTAGASGKPGSGQTQTQTDPTVLSASGTGSGQATDTTGSTTPTTTTSGSCGSSTGNSQPTSTTSSGQSTTTTTTTTSTTGTSTTPSNPSGGASATPPGSACAAPPSSPSS